MVINSYVTEKVETGFVNYLASSSLSASISNYYTFNNSVADKISPCVIVQCNSADEDFLGSGVWHVDTRVFFIYQNETSGSQTTKDTAYTTFCEVLYNNTSSLISDITSSVSNLGIYDIFGKGISNTIQDDHWVSENAFDVVAVRSA